MTFARLLPHALLLTSLSACAATGPAEAGTREAPPPDKGQAVAVFAGGCFWCMEKPFDKVPGVLSTTSGYTGGPEVAPTYQQVSYHQTGHYEAIRVVYDPSKVDYGHLLEVFWHNVDPTQADGQFCDRGLQYRTAIFTSDPEEKKSAEASKAAVAKELGQPVVTEILPAAPFWEAEDYHQDFYQKNPAHYTRYRTGCGRDARLEALWGDKAGH
ncbi:MAG: peptide-methionine (S)-S-oxide reductase MsrA [Alphaproteobacteria bacterium]|nr:peptide-methionine (S)-S-oxide reductase MsrA [Alphaproteobacteria bacterium]